MMQIQALDEIVNFIASRSPKEVLDFKASSTTKTRVYGLIEKQRNGMLTDAELSELEYYNMLEHIMRLAKAKAYKLLHT
jgi:hypothetical protein